MKNLSLLAIVAILLSGCTGAGKKTLTEESVPDNVAGFNEAEMIERLNDIRMGATPVVKPTGQSGAEQPAATPPAAAPSSRGGEVQLENLAGDFSRAIIKTNFGDITVELYASESPITVNNFLTLAKQGFYDGTRFHRVIKDFMIQGGDPLSKNPDLRDRWGTGGPDYRFADEINDRPLQKGSVAMANSGTDTNGSQFFIVTAGFTPWLDGKHTNFGFVREGLDVVEKIDSVITGQNDRPLEDVMINSVELIK